MYSYGRKNLIFSIWLKMPAMAFMISLLSPAASKSLRHSEYLAIDERMFPFWKSSAASASLLQGGSSAAQPAVPEFQKATGAGGSIISILEVCESDFATGLAKEETEESDSESEYEAMTQENAKTKTLKDQDVKYKTQEYTTLDKSISDLSSDLETEQSELAAVNTYYAKVKDRCIAKPESYEERAAKREAEIKGLKEALNVLESETALVQRRSSRRTLRGGSAAALLPTSSSV